MNADRPAETCAAAAAAWFAAVNLEDIPHDVIAHAKLRLLDLLGVTLAASATEYGRVVRTAIAALAGGEASGSSSVVGIADRVAPVWAAFANGTLAHALIFDDTHNETIVHPSGPIAGASLAIAGTEPIGGADFLATFIGATELTCRIGLAAVGQFHRSGFQPTAIIGPLGAAFAASRLYGLDVRQTISAVGNAGSFASGILESWSDGTWTQLLHPGWAAHSGVAAAILARSGWSGPSSVLEGRFGVFRTHVQQNGFPFAFERITAGLGESWESRRISFKPYPCAHVVHPFLDAALALHREGLRIDDIEHIECRIAGYMVPVVCEPLHTKRQPASDAQARTSLQYSLAEALVTGKLDATAYSPAALRDPAILALAGRIAYTIDATAPDSKTFRGWIVVTTRDGRRIERIESSNRGSPDHPLSPEEVRQKFRSNAATRIQPNAAFDIERFVDDLEREPSMDALLAACSPRASQATAA